MLFDCLMRLVQENPTEPGFRMLYFGIMSENQNTYLSVKGIKIQLKIAGKLLLELPPVCDWVFNALIVSNLLKLVHGGLGVVGYLLHRDRGLGICLTEVTVRSIGEDDNWHPDIWLARLFCWPVLNILSSSVLT